MVPDTVTTLGKGVFAYCRSLRSVTLPKTLPVISEEVFHRCCSLQSIKIPEGVTSIQRKAFSSCSSLKSIAILPESLLEIQEKAFKGCSTLTSISLPNSLARIEDDAFSLCTMLQNIVIPNKNCICYESIFSRSNNLVNYLDIIIMEEGYDWLSIRFENLPLHKLCNKQSIDIHELADIPLLDPFLYSFDKMIMTPLHVLSCNPNATLDMIQELACKCPAAAFVETENGSFPVELYLLTKNIVQGESNVNNGKIVYNQCEKIRSLLQRGATYNIHNIIKSDITKNEHKLWDILLAFQGTSNPNVTKR